MPLLPDPGKTDENQETLDFSVRLGSTLARDVENENRKIQHNWTQKPKRRDSSLILDLVGPRKVSSVTPRGTLLGEQTSKNGAKTNRSRRESRRTSNVTRISANTNAYITDREPVCCVDFFNILFYVFLLNSYACRFN